MTRLYQIFFHIHKKFSNTAETIIASDKLWIFWSVLKHRSKFFSNIFIFEYNFHTTIELSTVLKYPTCPVSTYCVITERNFSVIKLSTVPESDFVFSIDFIIILNSNNSNFFHYTRNWKLSRFLSVCLWYAGINS